MIVLITANCVLLALNIVVLIVLILTLITMADGHNYQWNSGNGFVQDTSKGRG